MKDVVYGLGHVADLQSSLQQEKGFPIDLEVNKISCRCCDHLTQKHAKTYSLAETWPKQLLSILETPAVHQIADSMTNKHDHEREAISKAYDDI